MERSSALITSLLVCPLSFDPTPYNPTSLWYVVITPSLTCPEPLVTPSHSTEVGPWPQLPTPVWTCSLSHLQVQSAAVSYWINEATVLHGPLEDQICFSLSSTAPVHVIDSSGDPACNGVGHTQARSNLTLIVLLIGPWYWCTVNLRWVCDWNERAICQWMSRFNYIEQKY